jgi:hypothetical protein
MAVVLGKATIVGLAGQVAKTPVDGNDLIEGPRWN